MSYNTDLQAFNTRLQSILDRVNNLPTGPNYSTTTLTIKTSGYSMYVARCMCVDGEDVSWNEGGFSSSKTLGNVLLGSLVYVTGPSSTTTYGTNTLSGCEVLMATASGIVFKVTSTSASIEITK